MLNPKSNNKSFQYSVKLSLYHKEIGSNFINRITKIEPYIIDLNWNNINFPPTNQDYASFEINNENISLNIYQLDNEIISQLYKSIHNRPKEINLLLLENKHYACFKNLKSLLN